MRLLMLTSLKLGAALEVVGGEEAEL